MRRDAVDPLQGIEDQHGGAGAGIGRGLHGKSTVVSFLEGVHGQGGACDVSGLGLERGRSGLDRRSGEDRETRVDPREQVSHETLREAVGLVEAGQQEAVEELRDGGRVEGRQGEELPIGLENAVGNDPVQMRIEVGAEGPVRLNGNDAGGADVVASEQCPEGLQDGIAAGARQQAEQTALAFEEPCLFGF